MDGKVGDQVLMGGIATLIARRLNAGELQLLPGLTALVQARIRAAIFLSKTFTCICKRFLLCSPSARL
jgi:hypothetical protein